MQMYKEDHYSVEEEFLYRDEYSHSNGSMHMMKPPADHCLPKTNYSNAYASGWGGAKSDHYGQVGMMHHEGDQGHFGHHKEGKHGDGYGGDQGHFGHHKEEKHGGGYGGHQGHFGHHKEEMGMKQHGGGYERSNEGQFGHHKEGKYGGDQGHYGHYKEEKHGGGYGGNQGYFGHQGGGMKHGGYGAYQGQYCPPNQKFSAWEFKSIVD